MRFFILDGRSADFWERGCPVGFLLVLLGRSAVPFGASLFPLGVLDGRC